MHALVVYDSKFGNTKIIADTVGEVIGGQVVSVSNFSPELLSNVDILVVGSPIHGWHASEAASSFLAHLEKSELKGKFVAAFDTGFQSSFSGNAAAKIMKTLKKAGGVPLISTHKFIVEHSEGPLGPNEIENAKEWAHELKTQYEQNALSVH